ncbi:MAG TPA: molecular chaperone HscC [Methylobacterium sp.]|jgi:molecular chaperone HscC|uniref:molecular chaperone HscC n=1 Tax=Methylorubrum sp. B1-46 TaxID=2897334 RepID=UPI001E3F0B51|nr:molecular chaperone HscC [Methylorubrum sp. B1-46]UGB27174.1 molecular chaperone HscC [Methylorubrum sp. B1-46]HEV2544577.1 molecular chaperone HscC [Methylobacterium sp.]
MAIVGIDLGTTNSAVAVWTPEGPRLIPNALGEPLTPSVVGLDADGTVLVGRAARERLATEPERTVASFKRWMGSGHVTRLGRGQSFRPEELSALVLKSLKADAQAHLGTEVTEAVISVPAYFNDIQRKATLDAARLAGLPVERLVNEPTAAALAYGVESKQEGTVLVFDLGGGTFDVSLLELYEGVMEVRATAGDVALGGDDFSEILAAAIAEDQRVALDGLSPGDRARLLRVAEAVKRGLTAAPVAAYEIRLGEEVRRGELDRARLETAAAPLLHRLRAPLERALSDSGKRLADLDGVILVGGATRMPVVRSLVARLFGRLPLVHVDPDTAVAQGAAVQAGLKARHAALEEVVMTDVCPFTLGIAITENARTAGATQVMLPIIERNAAVPVSRAHRITTIHDGQDHIAVEVFQGESLRPDDNIPLGQVPVTLPKAPAGTETAEVRFTYDINGALEVEVAVASTGLRRRQVFRNGANLDEAEIEARFAALAAIKLAPREQAENRALLARADALYAELRGDLRQHVAGRVARFEREIAEASGSEPEALRAAFAADLDALEDHRFRF